MADDQASLLIDRGKRACGSLSIAKLQSRRSGTPDTITDIVLAAIRVHRAAIVAEAGVATSADDDPFEDQTPRRRRDLDEPATQITLLLTPKNLQTLDEMAADADMSRSAFVTEALRRTLWPTWL